MQASIPVDRYPGPVCSYEIEDGTPVVSDTDASFERSFGTVEAGTAVVDAFAELDIVTDDHDFETALSGSNRFRVDVATPQETSVGGRYLVQTVPPANGKPGYLIFLETDDANVVDVSSGSLGLDHVASVISHDLRNPLDVAKARLRAGRNLDEDHHFEHVSHAHDRMERIIEDVLTLARGEDVVEPDEPVDLGTAAESAWDTVETENAALTIDRPMPTTVADPDRIKRLFENLFRNAVEHGSTLPETQPGQSGDELSRPNPPTGEATDGNGEREASGVTVSVGGLTDESVDGFYVADDGPGIAPAARERVFDPGYTSDDHGTGLGLAIVERIVDLHGWSIAVTTGTDGGARFEITGLEPT